ncbi:MAG TPA: enoyl-CoA hydratase/isomerase family protein, partial [Acidimicrobiia bacterium]|nr:enoyl-CoA hydratase/isomerase family protein [Acidimicrobiia bacterium]
MTNTYDGFHVEHDAGSGIAAITLDVPEKMNRVSMAARDQLAAVFGELGDDDAVRVIVLGGAGEKAFTAGGDIPGFMTRTPEELTHLAKNIAAAERCPKPVVAKLHGFTFGVGLELALACDLRVAADDTVLGLPEITLGMIPGSGGTQRLAHLIGLSRAKDAILRGRRIQADEARQWGLVAEVVPLADLD